MTISIRFWLREGSIKPTDMSPFGGQTEFVVPAEDASAPCFWTAAEIIANGNMIEYEQGEWMSNHHALAYAETFMACNSALIYGFDLVVTP